MEYDNFVTHDIDFYIGKPKSGKTRIAGSYPKPMLYISIGNDGGGRVLKNTYPEDIRNGLIKVKNLNNDLPDPDRGGKIMKTSIEKLGALLYDLRSPTADKFKTIIIDTVGSLQDDYKKALEFNKGNKAISQQEWGEISKMMLSIKDVMKDFSEDTTTKFIWISHTNELEVYETSGLDKEIRIVPDLTVKTGVKYMKDASNIFYCCRKTVQNKFGVKSVKFLTYIGPHPLMDTGTRDMTLACGDFVEDFSYEKWCKLIEQGTLDEINIVKIEQNKEDKLEE